DHSRVVAPVQPLTREYHVPVDFAAHEDNPRTVRMIARSRQDVMANNLESDRIAAALKAQKDEMRRDTPVTAPVHPAVQPGPLFGATFYGSPLPTATGHDDAPIQDMTMRLGGSRSMRLTFASYRAVRPKHAKRAVVVAPRATLTLSSLQ